MSKWQEIPSGRMGFGYEQAREAGVPWAWIKPFERPLHEINAELAARKKAEQEADERARNWPATPRLRTKLQLAVEAAVRAQAQEERLVMQRRMAYDKKMADLTGRTPLTASEIIRRNDALKRNKP
jgi:hypothetical protein